MITFIILMGIVFVILTVLASLGGAIVLVFGDVIVFFVIVYLIYKFVKSRKA